MTLQRPRFLDEYIGQDHAREQLEVLLANDFVLGGEAVTSIWISGPPGIGKTSLVQCVIRTYFCPHRVGHTPCKKCEVCLGEMDALAMLGLKSTTGAAVQRDGVEDIVSFMQSTPLTGHRGILLVDEAQDMSGKFKLLLDPLERVNGRSTSFFVTMDESKLNVVDLEAIKSRCLSIQLRPFSEQVLKDTLLKYFPFQDEAGTFLARQAGGNMRELFVNLMGNVQAHCKRRGLALEDITEEDLCNLFLGGATPSERKDFMAAFLDGDLAETKRIVDGWCQTAGAHLHQLVEFLLNDLIRLSVSPNLIHRRPVARMMRDLASLNGTSLTPGQFRALVLSHCMDMQELRAQTPKVTTPTPTPTPAPSTKGERPTAPVRPPVSDDFEKFSELMRCKFLPLLSPF